MFEVNMTSRYERTGANETLGLKKRWIAPEVTRLEFPKTAHDTGGERRPDSIYNAQS